MTTVCATCAVETTEPALDMCPICADERQYVPAGGQRWTTLDELAASGKTITCTRLEENLWGLTAQGVGIAQTALLVVTSGGSVLWDVPGYLDASAVHFVRSFGPVRAIVASHPHMYGAQTAWADALDTEVLVNTRDSQWVQRPSDRIRTVDGSHEVAPGVVLHRLGGHFAGSQVLEWPDGAGGHGTLLAADTIMVNPDLATTSFMRSYPNRIPLSAATTIRLADAVQSMAFDRCINNFGKVISTGAKAAIRRSAERQVAWMTGECADTA